MRKTIHAVAGTGALMLVSAFWLSTVASEVSGSPDVIAAVKRGILYGLPVMVLLMAAAGGSGFALAGKARSGLVGVKRRRMPFIALNGLMVLVPAALFLGWRAAAGQFDAAFYAVQGVELVAGAVNIALLVLNLRDGLAMTRARRLRRAQ